MHPPRAIGFQDIKTTTHLKTLMDDAERCAGLQVLAEDMLFDFSRQS